MTCCCVCLFVCCVRTSPFLYSALNVCMMCCFIALVLLLLTYCLCVVVVRISLSMVFHVCPFSCFVALVVLLISCWSILFACCGCTYSCLYCV